MASLLTAVDAEYVVIGGGLIDPEATTPEFRERYLRIIRESAEPYLWPQQRTKLKVLPATLGELSQAIGAALVALYTAKATA
jgi:predicted NBD/HSP70 family sugar kinase